MELRDANETPQAYRGYGRPHPRLRFRAAVGIKACDDFIAKYKACVTDKIPASQAEFKSALAQWWTEWKQLAYDPNNNLVLTGVCNQIEEQSKAAFTPYGCTF